MNEFNSAEYAWKDIEVVIMGRPIVRLLEIEYTTKTEQKPIYGRGKKAVGVQTGNEATTGSLSIGQSELEALIRKAKEIRPNGKLTDISFDISVAYRIDGDVNIVRDRIVTARVSEFSKSMKQGDTDMEVKLPFVCRDIEYSI